MYFKEIIDKEVRNVSHKFTLVLQIYKYFKYSQYLENVTILIYHRKTFMLETDGRNESLKKLDK